jgi:hypothetical protein
LLYACRNHNLELITKKPLKGFSNAKFGIKIEVSFYMKALFLFFLIFSQLVIAQNDTILIPELEGYYVGELNSNNMPNGKGKLFFFTGGSYIGDWSDGKYHGKGILEYSNGDVYSGQFKNNLKSGFGKMLLTNELEEPIEYKGNWKKGLMHGKGRIEGPIWGEGWEGKWKRNIRKKGNYTKFVAPNEDEYMKQ